MLGKFSFIDNLRCILFLEKWPTFKQFLYLLKSHCNVKHEYIKNKGLKFSLVFLTTKMNQVCNFR